MKGRTKWFPCGIKPVRNGIYECQTYFGGGFFIMMLEWDGKGFLTGFPCVVHHWRGITKAEYLKESK